MIEIDRSGWRRVRFGDVVANTKEAVKDPVGAGLDRVVALEHMQPGSLQLSGWQDAADGTTFTRRFRVGQTLFAKRRAYQRKVAYAEFDGVCSGDILALEAKADELLPELLPFIVQSDAFFEHALRTSAGSLSPRTKWQDLATWEFELPSPDEQKRIAALLWSTERTVRRHAEVSRVAASLLGAQSDELCWGWAGAGRALADLSTSGRLLDGDWIESKDQSPVGIRLLQLADIGVGRFQDKSRKFVSEETFGRLRCTEVLPGDLLISRMAEPIGRTCEFCGLPERAITAVDVSILRIDPGRDSRDFWTFTLNAPKWTARVLALGRGSTRVRVSRKDLEAIEVAPFELAVQQDVAEHLGSIAHAVDAADAAAAATKDLRDSLAQWLFGGGS